MQGEIHWWLSKKKKKKSLHASLYTVGFDLETYFIITLGRLHRNEIKIW
jgi:hypothetical protein